MLKKLNQMKCIEKITITANFVINVVYQLLPNVYK